MRRVPGGTLRCRPAAPSPPPAVKKVVKEKEEDVPPMHAPLLVGEWWRQFNLAMNPYAAGSMVCLSLVERGGGANDAAAGLVVVGGREHHQQQRETWI